MNQGLRDRLPVRRPRPTEDGGSHDPAVDRILARLETLPDALSARPEFTDALRARVLAQFEAQLPAFRPSDARRTVRPRLARLALAGSMALVTVAGAAGAAAAADSSLPGDPLYGLKRAIEQMELAFTSTDRRHEVELSLLGERIEELRLEAAAGDWTSVRGLCIEITTAGADLLERGSSLGNATDAMLAAIDEARAVAPASEQGHLQSFEVAAQQLAKRDGHGGGPGTSPSVPTTAPTSSAEPSQAAKPDKGQSPADPDEGQGDPNQGNQGQGQGGNQGQGQGNPGGDPNQGNQGQGQGGNQGQGQGNPGGDPNQGNQGQGQGGNQGQGQGNGNQGQGQGNGNQGQGQGNGNQGKGQDKGKGPKSEGP